MRGSWIVDRSPRSTLFPECTMADKANHQVLRGLPFRPSPELEAQAARLKRWTYILGGVAALALVLLVAAVVMLFNQGSQRPAAGAKTFKDVSVENVKQA